MKSTLRTPAGIRQAVTSRRLRLEHLEPRDVPAAIGALDPSFGTAGKVIQSDSPYQAVAVQADGKIVAVGSESNDFTVVRYNPDGSLDTGFATGGIQTINFALGGGDVNEAFDVAIQADGKIVVVGSTSTTADGDDFAIARLNPNGSLDTTFGSGGKVNVDFAGGGTDDDTADGVAIAANGNIYVVGTVDTGLTTTSGGIVALTSTGAPLTGFGSNGHQFVSFGGMHDAVNAIAIQPADGKLVLAGDTDAVAANGLDFALTRLDPTTGMIDAGFGTAGVAAINFGAAANDTAFDVAIQADGKIVAAGQTDVTGNDNAAVARLNANGTPDTSFGSNGLVNVDFGGAGDSANRVLIQPSGRIVLVGNSDSDIVVAQLLPTGAPDTSFNGTGQSTIGVGSYEGNGGALLPNGRIVVAGRSNSNSDGAVARLIGRLDSSTTLGVSGSPDGTAQVFTSTPSTGQLSTTAQATIAAFGTVAVDVRVATADVNGDGIPDVILVTGPGTAIRLAVVSGADDSTVLVQPFDPFGGNFTGGGFVTAGDFGNTGRADVVVTPDEGGGPRVTIYSLATDGSFPAVANFFGINDPNFRGGARAAVGDINGDGVPDLVVAAGFGGGPRVAVYDGKTVQSGNPTKLVNDFFAFSGSDAQNLRNGVYVAVGDVNGDGFDDLIFGGGPGGAPRVYILSGAQVAAGQVATAQAAPIANFFVAGNSSDRGGVRVAAKDLDGDGRADLVVGSGQGDVGSVRAYLGKNFTSSAEPSTFQALDPFSGSTLADGVYVG